jgi:hypothetical protein
MFGFCELFNINSLCLPWPTQNPEITVWTTSNRGSLQLKSLHLAEIKCLTGILIDPNLPIGHTNSSHRAPDILAIEQPFPACLIHVQFSNNFRTHLSKGSHEAELIKPAALIRVVPVKCFETSWRDYNHWRLVTLIRATIHDTPGALEFHGDSQLGACGVILKVEVAITQIGVFEFVSNIRVSFSRKICDFRIAFRLSNALENIGETSPDHLLFLNLHHRDFLGPVHG